MSVNKSTHKLRHTSTDATAWDKAIADMEKLIQRDKIRIADLRRSIKAFRELRDENQPFPGTSESAQGLMGQE